MEENAPAKSRLVPVGALLILASMLAGRLIALVATGDASKPAPPSYLTDLFGLAFFAGIACLLIGWLRNRRARKEAGASPAGS